MKLLFVMPILVFSSCMPIKNVSRDTDPFRHSGQPGGSIINPNLPGSLLSECHHGDGICTPGCPAEADSDCRCGPLKDRLTISDIPVDTPVALQQEDVSEDMMMSSSPKPMILSPLSSGDSKIGWVDRNGKFHITPVSMHDKRTGSDLITQGDIYRDMIAHEDGAAVLFIKGQDMFLVRLNQSGGEVFSVKLTGLDSGHTSNDFHYGSIAWNGERYAAYYGVHGGGHEGDSLHYIDATGRVLEGGWSWGCSHSMDMRIIATGQTFVPICISDCYPEKGIIFNAQQLISAEDGNCGGSTDARFGGIVDINDRIMIGFASKQKKNAWDVAITGIKKTSADSTAEVIQKSWLTETPGDERYVKIARYGSRMMLTAWDSGASSQESVVQLLDADGKPLGSQERIPVQIPARGDFKTFPNGDIGWVSAWGDANTVKLVRLRYCE